MCKNLVVPDSQGKSQSQDFIDEIHDLLPVLCCITVQMVSLGMLVLTHFG